MKNYYGLVSLPILIKKPIVKLNRLKKLPGIILLFFSVVHLIYAQENTLLIQTSSKQDSIILSKINYQKQFPDANSLNLELDSVLNQVHLLGFIEALWIDKKHISNQTSVSLLLGKPYQGLILYSKSALLTDEIKQKLNIQDSIQLNFQALGTYLEGKKEKLAQYAERVWKITEGNTEEKAQLAIEKTIAFFHQMGMQTKLSEYTTDYKKTAEIFNQVGESAKKNGLTFFYHNHGYGHKAVDGVVPFQMILDNTDADLVKMQMDVFWFTAAGIDPKKYLKENPNRFPLLHVKDMREKKTFSGGGGNMGEWMGLFPYLADAGDGVLDLSEILCEAKKSGAKHFLLEKDLTPDHVNALQKSFDYLSALNLKC